MGVFILFLFLLPSAAQERDVERQLLTALNNVQEEYTRCATYFRALIACSPPATKKEAEAQIYPTVKVFEETAVTIGRELGMTQDAMEQRLKRVFDEQNQLTNNKVCLIIDSLVARLAAPCKELGEHADRVLEKYMRKYNSR
jgi:hypothetical protein